MKLRTVLFSLAALGFCASASAQAPIVIKFSHVVAVDTPKGKASEFFKKIECFCFKQQTLKANESREMPVVFVIDPDLPKDVKTITLSYTFFEIHAPSAIAPAMPNKGT